MDTVVDYKKETLWFAYQDNRLIGPVPTEELAHKINSGNLAEDSYVWSQGFTDWICLEDLPDFTVYRLHLQSKKALEPETITLSEPLSHLNFLPTPGELSPKTSTVSLASEVSENLVRFTETASIPNPAPVQVTTVQTFPQRRIALVSGASLFLAIALSLVYHFSSHSHPEILQTLSPEDRERLKSATEQFHWLGGPVAEIALLQTASTPPRFIIATNLPEKTSVELRIDGIPGKLVGRQRFARKTSLPVNNGFILTKDLTETDGGPLKTGLYRLTAKTSENGKTLLTKTFLLSGTPNFDFENELGIYQNQVEQLKKVEAQELQQTLQICDDLLKESSLFLSQNSPGLLAQDKQNRLAKLSSLISQLNALSLSWQTEQAKTQMVFLESYALLRELIEKLNQVIMGIESNPVGSLAQNWLLAQKARDLLAQELAKVLGPAR